MKGRPILDFFDISSNVEELPKNELFKLKGGYSDTAYEDTIENVDVYAPGGGNNGGDDEGHPFYGDDYDEDFWNDREDYEYVGNQGNDEDENDNVSETNENNNDGNSGDTNQQPDPVEQLLSKFKFDENLSEQFKQRLKDALTSIQNTAIGKKLIDMLASKTGDIRISDNGQAAVQGSTLFMGIMNDDPVAFAGHYTTLSLGHEMVHLLQNAEYGTTRSEISYELEARLVEYHLAKELRDLENFFRNFSDDSYQQSFVDFAEGRTGSINDFNNLIDGFKDGTNGGAFYNGYDETHVDSFDDIIIDEILR